MDLPDAGTKLRSVLDYLPCEACLAQPTKDQELLCTVCARLDRQIAVRVGTRTTVLVERPSPPEAPIVIPPAPAVIPEVTAPRDIAVTFAGEESEAPPGSIEVVVEPLVPLAPLPVAAPLVAVPAEFEAPPAEFERPPVAFEAPPAVIEEAPPAEPEFDDLVSFVPARDEFFDYQAPPPRRAPREIPVEEEPAPVLAKEEPAPIPEDDFVFRPPPRGEAPPPTPREPVLADDIIPTEEVPVERAREERAPWAPPPDFLADEPAAPEEEILETEVVEASALAAEEEEIVETEMVEDEEIFEMEAVPDEEPALIPRTGDLYRLRGFDTASGAALARSGIHEVAHLAGHDAGELAQRSGLAFDKLLAWIQVADLVHEAGVPLDAAIALVAAGVAGPRGLAEAEPEEVADRVSAFGGYTLSAREVRRWKRRA